MVDNEALASPAALAVIGMNVLTPNCRGLVDFEKAVYHRQPWHPLEPELTANKSELAGETRDSGLLRVVESIFSEFKDGIAQQEVGICFWGDSAAGVSREVKLFEQNLKVGDPVLNVSGQAIPLLAGYMQAAEWLKAGKCRLVLLACTEGSDVHAALLLQPLADARASHRPILAVCDWVCSSNNSETILAALQNARVATRDLGYLDVISCAGESGLAEEISNLAKVFTGEINDLTTVLGLETDPGGGTSPYSLSALIKTVMSLYHRFLPGAVQALPAPILEQLVETSFYLPDESRPWLLNRTQDRRRAGLSLAGPEGSGAFWLLSEVPQQEERPNPTLSLADYRLFPLAANSIDELSGMVKLLRLQAEKDPDLVGLSRKWFGVYEKRPSATLALMVTGSTQAELLREIEFAQKGVPAAVEKGNDWQTPAGSYFTPRPLGQQAGVCLVYPGAFNSYVGIGRELFRLFPQIYSWMEPLASDLEYVFCDHYLYPRSLGQISKEELNELESALADDAVAMMTSGMAFSVVYTYILEKVFKVKPASALGYSLGEMSMFFAVGVWEEGDKASEGLARSPLFSDRLAGPLNAVREAWGMPPQKVGRSEDLWANHVLMVSPERVQEALKLENRVYLTHINTPRQVVIAGDKEACQRVIQNLKCSSLKAPFSYALHCDAMKSEYGELRRLNMRAIKQWPDLQLYSAANYDLFKPDPEDIAHQVAFSLCTHLNFPQLVQRAYSDGARIFIEVGAGGNCAKWIDESLRGQPCLTMSVNRKGMDDAATLVRTLAKLASHRVPVDLSPLYPKEQ